MIHVTGAVILVGTYDKPGTYECSLWKERGIHVAERVARAILGIDAPMDNRLDAQISEPGEQRELSTSTGSSDSIVEALRVWPRGGAS